MAKGIVSEDEWAAGASSQDSSAKASSVLAYLTKVKGGASMNAIRDGTNIKWPYGTVKNLVKIGTLEEKKIGKALYYRMKKAKVPK